MHPSPVLARAALQHPDAASDIDRLRAAVGDEALTFLGGSYGAKLGAEYARQFPDSVRAAVLDGPSEPVPRCSTALCSRPRASRRPSACTRRAAKPGQHASSAIHMPSSRG
jgi:pimeloyl-ACP methyl ester carboxylesterase